MSVCTFLASDGYLEPVTPLREYPLDILIANGTITIEDGGADDNYFLHIFPEVGSYTDKKYGVALEWNYTEGRSKQIIEYIRNALRNTDSVELWHVWLTDFYEFEERPYIHRKTVTVDELTVEHIREIDNAEIWNIPDKMYPDRPSFYCLTIRR